MFDIYKSWKVRRYLKKWTSKENYFLFDLYKHNKTLLELVDIYLISPPSDKNLEILKKIVLDRSKKSRRDIKKAVLAVQRSERKFGFVKDDFFNKQIEELTKKESILKNDVVNHKLEDHQLKDLELLFLNKLNELDVLYGEIINKKNYELSWLKNKLDDEKRHLDVLDDSFKIFFGLLKEKMNKFAISRRKFFKAMVGVGSLGFNLGKEGFLMYVTYFVPFALALKTLALKLPMPQTKGVAILISNLEFTSVPLFNEAYVSRVELALNKRAKRVFTNAKKADLLNVMIDETISTVVILSHQTISSVKLEDGSYTSLQFTNDFVSKVKLENPDLYQRFNKENIKDLLILHGCKGNYRKGVSLGVFGNDLFGYYLFKDVLYYKRFVNTLDFFCNPLVKDDHWINTYNESRVKEVIAFKNFVQKMKKRVKGRFF